MKHLEKEPNKLLISFSAYTNGKILFDTKPNKSTNSINCLNGIRALSVFWIMFGHRFTFQRQLLVTNPEDILRLDENIFIVIVNSFTLAVDTFFLMGALLMTISILSALDKKSFNIFRIICHRYLRYTPTLAALVLHIVSIGKLAINGPVPAVDEYVDACKDFWWSTLLHVQNYVNLNNFCVPHSWYLSADFQLFIISPILIYPGWKYGWKFLWTLPVLALMSSSYALTVFILRYNLQTAADVYFQTHFRCGPWLIGILFGFFMYKNRNEKFSVSKKMNAILWISTLSLLLTIVLLSLPFNRLIFRSPRSISNHIFEAFHRNLWAIGLCWIIFACHKLKTGGIVRWFLELPQWQPIARMSLSIYLVHLFIQLTLIMSQKEPKTFEIFPVVSD
jgi:peptidoglycan/LPS O-acetylase OafA/YrhL